MLNLIKLMVAAALMCFSVNASAYLLEDVGSNLDTLIGYADDINGATAEEEWIEGILTFYNDGTAVDIEYTQIDNAIAWDWVTDDGIDGTVAADFSPYNPEYYLVKVGNGSKEGTEWETYLYDNMASLQFAYLNLADFFGANATEVELMNIGVISHYGRTGDVVVPEPGMVGLLAIGLLGIGAARRRMKV